jgi:hypothetical protein
MSEGTTLVRANGEAKPLVEHTEEQKKALQEIEGIKIMIGGKNYLLGDYYQVTLLNSGHIAIRAKVGRMDSTAAYAIWLSIVNHDRRKSNPLTDFDIDSERKLHYFVLVTVRAAKR